MKNFKLEAEITDYAYATLQSVLEVGVTTEKNMLELLAQLEYASLLRRCVLETPVESDVMKIADDMEKFSKRYFEILKEIQPQDEDDKEF